MFKSLTSKDKKNFTLLLLGALFHFCSLSFMFLLPKYIKNIGGNETEMGLIIGMFLLPALIVPPIAGYIADHHPGKKLMMGGTLIMILSTLAFLLSPEISFWIYIFRFFQGTGHLLFFSVLFSTLSHIIPNENRGQGVSYLAIMFQVANSTGSLLAEKIILWSGFQSYFIFSFMIGIFGILIISLLKENELRNVRHTIHEPEKVPYFRLVTQKKYLGGFLLIFILGGVFGTTIQFMPTFLDFLLTQKVIAEVIPASYFLFSSFLIIGLSRIFLSHWTDRLGQKKMIYLNIPILLLALLVPSFMNSIWLVILMAFLFGVSCGFLYPAVNSFVQNRALAHHRGKITGILVMLYDAGFSGFAFLMGPFAFHYGYWSMFYLLTGLLILGVIIFMIMERNYASKMRMQLKRD